MMHNLAFVYILICLALAPICSGAATTNNYLEIVFMSTRSGTPQIWAMQADGSGAHRLATNSFSDWGPAPSRDGTRVAYTRNLPNGEAEVRLMNANGSNDRLVKKYPAAQGYGWAGFCEAWLPDDSRLVISHWDYPVPDGRYSTLSLDGLTEQTLISSWMNHHGAAFSLRFSMDGNWVSCSLNQSGQSGPDNIFKARYANGAIFDVQQLTANTTYHNFDDYACFSPDGTLVTSRRVRSSGAVGVFVMGPWGETNILPSSVFDAVPRDWSPGNRILLEAYDDPTNGFPHIYVVNADGSGLVRLTSGNCSDSGPRWRVVLLTPPHIQTQPENQAVNVGTACSFTVAISGSEPIRYQWFKNSVILVNSARIFGATNSSLIISNLTMADVGIYSVMVSNYAGSVTSSNAVLAVIVPDTSKPTLTITSPTIGQRWSNNVSTVKGRVTDNGLIGSVYCQLNGGAWSTAQTASAWSNWTAQVSPTPGLNTVWAYAVDVAGNRSATNSVTFTHVPSAPLCVQIDGCVRGGLIPGLLLELGKTATLKPTPCSGYVLTNWTVQVDGVTMLSTNRAVPFVMRSNLCLLVTFVDVARPTVTITAPTAGQRWSNAVLTVRGKVTDNGPIGSVYCQLNGGAWSTAQTASAWSNWTAQVSPTPGLNTVRAYAVDEAGNRSATNRVIFTHVPSAPLCVQIDGCVRGGLIPGLLLELGKTATLKPTPCAGYVLTNWTVQVNGVTVLSTNRAVPFVMRSNLCLLVAFVDVAKPVLTITGPTAGQQVNGTNAEFTVRGKASDNAGVAQVWVKLNGGDWHLATGTTNWQMGEMLQTGANKLSAFAVDTSGNKSPTNSVSFSFMPSNEKDIRTLIARLKSRGEAHDVNGFKSLFAPDYMHGGDNFADFSSDLAPVLSTIQTFTFTITNIVISGDTAQVFGTCRITFNNGRAPESWREPDVTGDSPGFGWLKLTANGWRVHGNQIRATVRLATGYNDGGGNSFFRVRAESSAEITTVTFSGPDISDSEMEPDFQYGGFTAFIVDMPDPLPAVGAKYSFVIDYADGTQEIIHDTVKSWVPKGPSVTVTTGARTATIRWTSVSGSVPNASHYWVRVMGPGVYWESDDLPLTRTSAVFNEDHQAQGTLQSGEDYVAEVFIFDKSEDYAYQQADFSMPFTAPESAPTESTQPTSAAVAASPPTLVVKNQWAQFPLLRFECGKGGVSVSNGNFQMGLNGPVGATVVVESSPDLVHWVPVQTNTVPAEGVLLSVPMSQQPGQFFRAVIVTKP